MIKRLISLKKCIFGLLPDKIRTSLLGRFRSLTYLAPERDHKICFYSVFYGEVCFILNPIYRIEKEILYQQFYDKKTLLYIKRLVRNGDVIIDVGANIGSMTLPLAYHAGISGKVFAFEPGPILFNRLKKNVMENQNISGRIECCNLGLSDSDGHLYWQEEMHNRGNAVLSNNKNGIRVNVITLDKFILNNSIEQLNFIKIDVEGMELEVLNGALKVIGKFTPIILFETNVESDKNKKIERVFNLLSKYSYEFFEIDVPERQLANDCQGFNFIPTSYPKLPCDTLAVPKMYKNRLQVNGID